jgi:hypothetical protein
MVIPLAILRMGLKKMIHVLEEVKADIPCLSAPVLNLADQAYRVISFEDSNLDDLVVAGLPNLDGRGDQTGQGTIARWLCYGFQHVSAF